MKLSSLTDIGIKRSENQDNYWAARLDIDDKEAGVICLCDGMGGLSNGGLASKTVVEAVKDFFMEDYDFDRLEEVIKDCNTKVHDIGQKQDKGMGTTCTILFCYDGRYNILHVGDSRAYLIKDGKLQQLSTDHSALQMYKVTKTNNPKLYAKYKNLLTRCIGVKEQVKIDKYSGSYSSGDTFMLCSDGLWHYFDDNQFSIDSIEDLQGLIQSCIDSGETDNITVGILQV